MPTEAGNAANLDPEARSRSLSRTAEARSRPLSAWRRDLIAAAAVGALTVVLVQVARRVDPSHGPISFVLMLGVPALVAFRFVARPRRFAMALATILIACVAGPDRFGTVLHAERSFYGVHRVTTDPSGRFRVLLHGHTIHGRQSLDPSRRKEPLTYFHRTGRSARSSRRDSPAGGRRREVAVIGLGSGSLITYARPRSALDVLRDRSGRRSHRARPCLLHLPQRRAGTVAHRLGRRTALAARGGAPAVKRARAGRVQLRRDSGPLADARGARSVSVEAAPRRPARVPHLEQLPAAASGSRGAVSRRRAGRARAVRRPRSTPRKRAAARRRPSGW